MAKTITVNLFSVSRTPETQPLSETLQEFAGQELERRARSDIRLEKVEPHDADHLLPVKTWHLDFARSRDIGPGKMSKDRGVSDVGLEADELFGEETAALYVPDKRWLLVLNNHYGVGPSRMASYFNALDPGNFERHLMYSVEPKIDQEALRRMERMERFSEVEITANVGVFEDSDNVGESLLDAANGIRASRIYLKFIANEKYQRNNHLGLDAVKSFVTRLLGKEEIDKFKVKGADEQLEKQDRVIDLIEHKVRRRYTDRELEIVNHRYTYDSKIQLLRKACRSWLDTIG